MIEYIPPSERTYGGAPGSQYVPPSERVYNTAPTTMRDTTSEPTRDYTQGGYTVEDLTQDEFFIPIQKDMVNRFGSHILEDDRQTVVDKWLNNYRGFKGGNSVRTVNQMAYLAAADEDELAIAGQAMAIFEGLPNIWSEESSWSNALEGTMDYARAAILDPVNVLGGIAGKAASSGGFRSTALAAQIAARKAYQKTLTKQAAQGVTKELAENAGLKVAQRVYSREVSKINNKLVAQSMRRKQVVVNTSSELLKKIATRGNLVEAGIVGTIDGIAAGATDWAYQSALEMTGVTDERSVSQSLVTGLASLAAAGTLSAMGGLLKRSGETIGPDVSDIKTKPEGAKISGTITQMAKEAKDPKVLDVKKNDWMKDALAGKELSNLDTNFWITFIKGDEDAGIVGLVQKLKEQGYGYIARGDDDKISNWLGDIVAKADPEDFQKFVDEFEEFSPTLMDELKDMSQEEVAKVFKAKVRGASRVMEASSYASKQLGLDHDALAKEDILMALRADTGGKITGLIESKMSPFMQRTLPRSQNQLIRLLVANLSTTQLNLLGWSAASSMDTATNLVTAALQAPWALATGNKQSFKQATALARGAITKIRNVVDANTTYDEFVKYSQARPSAVRELMNVLPGGVESSKKLYDELDLNAPIASMEIDKFVDLVQDIQLVRAQDGMTKSIEFMTELDTLIRKEYGMSYKEFMGQDNYWGEMATAKFQKLERKAVMTAMDNIFSRSYGKMGGTLGEIADIVEKSRNIPVVGVMLPFGRFFNNTVAFMSDYGGISLAMRTLGLNRSSTETTQNLLARTAVGWSLAFSLAPNEEKYIDMGLNWDEQTQIGDVTGAITSEKYNFPYAFTKALARAIAHVKRGEALPEAMVSDVARTIGPESFTRGITDAFGASGEAFFQIFTGEEPIKDVIVSLGSALGGQVVGSATRFLEPANAVMGMAQGKDRVVQDRRQGSKFFNEATKYIDNFIEVYEDQRYSATDGPLRAQDSKFVSPVREVRNTSLSRVMALAGVKEWDRKVVEIGKDSPAASNRYAQLYFDMNERAAEQLLADSWFREASMEQRGYVVSDLLKMNKEYVKAYMEGSVDPEDFELKKVIDLRGKWSESDLRRETKELGMDTDLEALTYEQLILLESSLETREDLQRDRY